MEKFPRRRKVYGKKTTTAPISEIFTRDPTPPKPTRPRSRNESPARRVLDDLTTTAVNVKIDSKDEKDGQGRPLATKKSKNAPLPSTAPIDELTSVDDLTAALNGVKLENNSKEALKRKPKKTRNPSTSVAEPTSRSTRATHSTKPTTASKGDSRLTWLKPLTDAYALDGQPEMEIRQWKDILDPDWALEKIAESSYAEVYKVANPSGTSILKIMALRPPAGPGSQRETAVTVESVVSEVLIMDMMAEIPGFLEFKAAHVIAGKAPRGLVEAFEIFDEKSVEGTFFPRPASYHKEQLFLALELGDAGTDIEHFEIITVAQLWDIFLWTTFALASGEAEFRFEHRDLHEGNVCVKQTSTPRPLPPSQAHKLGYSGLEVTLLDYTLSRAQDKTVLYRDLESDLEIFNASDVLQHQMYRRMRTWAFFRTHGKTHPLFDSEETPAHGSWEDYMPYTNVIWLYYLLTTIMKFYKGKDMEAFEIFVEETSELRARIDPDRRLFDGGLESAGEVLNFCMDEGWINEGDLLG